MYLYGGFACDVCDQEVHGYIFTVHVSVHPVLDVSRHLVSIQIVEVLQQKQKVIRCRTDILQAFSTIMYTVYGGGITTPEVD